MAAVILTISGHRKGRQVELNANGTIIGRSEQCDVVLEGTNISREHARIFRDPFGRWIIEDLGSSNGIFINGMRVEACAVLPGEPIIIGLFTLSIQHAFAEQIERDDLVRTTANIIVDNFETEIFSGETTLGETLSEPSAKRLSQIMEHLSELTSLVALYPEVCRHLARESRTVATVLRLPEKTKPLPKSPDILACHFGDIPDDAMTQDAPGFYPSHLAFRVSRHVLELVRSTGDAVMAKSIYSSDAEITSTVLDEHSPRTVICAALGEATGAVDLLYLDIPIDKTTSDMLEFVRDLCRRIISTRNGLILTEAKAQRSVLDYQLSLAREIQSRLAPTIPQGLRGIELTLYYKPVVWVGADYCDVWLPADGRLAFAIGHVSDKGLPAAMAMSELRTILRSALSFCSELSEVMKLVNLHLIQNLPGRMSATLLLGVFDQPTGNLEYVSAGSVQAFIVGLQSAGLALDQPDNPPLGTADASFKTNVETIQQNAQLLIFTEGLTEATSPDGTKFGLQRVINLLKITDDRSAGGIINSLTKAAEDFRHPCPQQNDITVFGLFYSGSTSS